MSRQDPHIFEFEFPGGRIFEVEAEPHQQEQALRTAKDVWAKEQSQRTGALRQSSKSEYRPGGFTGADFQNPVQRALNPVIDAVSPFTLLELPKTLSNIAGYVGGIGERAEQGISSGVNRILGGDIAGGIGEGVSSSVGAGAQIPIDLAKGIGNELSQSYESAKEGDLAGAGVRAGMTIAPFIKPIASGLRAGVGMGASGVADVGTGVSRGSRLAGEFLDAPLIEAPETTFQHATRNLIPSEDIPHALDTLSEHAQRTGVTPRTAFQSGQAFNADTKLLSDYYDGFINPQGNLTMPGSRLDLYQRQVAAIPEHVRQNNTPLYTRTMRRLQDELRKPDLTVHEADRLRSSLTTAGMKRGPIDAANAEGILNTALEDAAANSVRDNLYDFLDSFGQNHGSIAREINERIGRNMRIEKAFKTLEPDSVLEAGRSKTGMLMELPSKVASLTGIGGGGLKPKINEGIFDAVQRWVPQRGPLPNNPYRPLNPSVPYGPGVTPPPLAGTRRPTRQIGPGTTYDMPASPDTSYVTGTPAYRQPAQLGPAPTQLQLPPTAGGPYIPPPAPESFIEALQRAESPTSRRMRQVLSQGPSKFTRPINE